MRPCSRLALALALGASALAACLPAKDDAKGVVDDSPPPPLPSDPGGKADDASRTLPLAIESAHPYANNLDRAWTADLAIVPSCARTARLHFAVLRTEADYDFVTVTPGGEPSQRFDGDLDDTWTEWFGLRGGPVTIRLRTDGSVTRHGFAIDGVEWQGAADRCPLYPLQPCPEGSIAVIAPVGVCECPPPPQCVGLGNVEISHLTTRGRLHAGKQVTGTAASTTGLGADDRTVTTAVGTIDLGRLGELVYAARTSGVLFGGYDRPVDPAIIRDAFTIRAGNFSASFVAAQGAHSPAVAAVIASFDALFGCAGADAPLTCGAGLTCVDDACQPAATCSCAEIYQPVCGIDGRTYGNACQAGCAAMDLAHDGECGAIGDRCGGLAGGDCHDGARCRYDVSTFTPPHPDAVGTCVAQTYCDAPVDCRGLPAPAVVGAWTCPSHACVFRAGTPWTAVTDGRFETAHPYANGTSVFKSLTLPAGAQALRLITAGSFQLEAGYDFLEVWSWQASAWRRVARFTGTTGPAATESWPGRHFALRFVSDSSVTGRGFAVTPEWR